ncbi:unnamed protein product [Discosporangium mesarthrocarpum]
MGGGPGLLQTCCTRIHGWWTGVAPELLCPDLSMSWLLAPSNFCLIFFKFLCGVRTPLTFSHGVSVCCGDEAPCVWPSTLVHGNPNPNPNPNHCCTIAPKPSLTGKARASPLSFVLQICCRALRSTRRVGGRVITRSLQPFEILSFFVQYLSPMCVITLQ